MPFVLTHLAFERLSNRSFAISVCLGLEPSGPLLLLSGPLLFLSGPLALLGGPLALLGGPLALLGGPLALDSRGPSIPTLRIVGDCQQSTARDQPRTQIVAICWFIAKCDAFEQARVVSPPEL